MTEQTSKTILSIDVGVRHLGLCLLQAPSTILRWTLVAIPGKPVEAEGVFRVISEAMQGWEEPDEIVVERQPGKSQIMARVQHYCEMMGVCVLQKPVLLMEPKTKLWWAYGTKWWPSNIKLDAKKKWTYRERKTAAMSTAAAFLRDGPASWAAFYFAQSKRDDLADSLLQALAQCDPAFATHRQQTSHSPQTSA